MFDLVGSDSLSNVFCNLWLGGRDYDSENMCESEVFANGKVVNYIFVVARVAVVSICVINSEFVWQGVDVVSYGQCSVGW